MPAIIDKSDALYGTTSCAACGDPARDDRAAKICGYTVCRHCYAELSRAFASIDDLTADTAPLFWKILFAEYRREYEVYTTCPENHLSA